MREIKLTQGKVALVDGAAFAELNKHKWHAYKHNDRWYAARNIRLNRKTTKVLMHRQILDFPIGQDIDHWNRNGLDNRRENLRPCTRSQNLWNSKRRNDNVSGRKGISWHRGKWCARIQVFGKGYHLGHFADKFLAALIYQCAAYFYFGEFARAA